MLLAHGRIARPLPPFQFASGPASPLGTLRAGACDRACEETQVRQSRLVTSGYKHWCLPTKGESVATALKRRRSRSVRGVDRSQHGDNLVRSAWPFPPDTVAERRKRLKKPRAARSDGSAIRGCWARFVKGFVQRRVGDVRCQHRSGVERLFITQTVAMEMGPHRELPHSP